jgi:ParB family chromosome partitioning protein
MLKHDRVRLRRILMALTKKGLGRGLSALIPDAEMDALSDVTRENTLFTQPDAAATAKKRSRRATSSSVAAEASGLISVPSTPEDLPRARTASKNGGSITKIREDVTVPLSLETPAPTVNLEIRQITPNPFQPRRTFDAEEMQDLAASIRLHGILQPVLVRPAEGEDGTFQLVAGERRWRAAQLAGLERVPVIIRPMADQQALELALIENVQRHDISAIDAAMAYERLANEFGLSQEQISRRVGKSRSAVANTMRLLSLPEEARKAIEEGLVTEGHGRAILLATGEGARRAIFRRVVRDKLSVRDAERLARASSSASKGGENEQSRASASDSEPSEWLQAEREVTKKLGARVKIKVSAQRGSVLIECGNDMEVRRVLALLQKIS